jgi:hypothetical protein
MKYFLLISATLLVIALASLPMGYYTFLRIVVTIAAVLAAIHEYKQGEFNAWVIAFGNDSFVCHDILQNQKV